jgi:YidC/Oxa1 family membrane protein insertase
MADSLERRHLSLWPFAASKPSARSSTIPQSSPSSDAANQPATWTQDPWSAESGSMAAPSGESLAQAIPETLSSPSPNLVQQTPVSPSASTILHITPTDPLTNLPVDGNHIGDLANLGLGGWGPVGLVQNLLEQIHVYSGLPWWGTVVFVSIATRVILSPMLIRGMGRSARFLDIREQVERIVSSAKDASPEDKITASLEAREIMKKHDGSPFGSLVPMLAQAGIVFTVFLALQGMTHLPVESLKNGGLAWFQDLTVPDPTYYLPTFASLVFLGGLEVCATYVGTLRYYLCGSSPCFCSCTG